jgi:hypothetical protein
MGLGLGRNWKNQAVKMESVHLHDIRDSAQETADNAR